MYTSETRLCSALTLEFAKFVSWGCQPVTLAHAVSLAAWFRRRASMVQRLSIEWHEDMVDDFPLCSLLLCPMPRLRELAVNFLSGGRLDLPQLWQLQRLTSLTDQQISCNILLGSQGPAAALPWLEHLKQLRALQLSSMHLLPPAVEALRSLSAVTSVDVGISEDAGQVLPASLAHLSELRSLRLALAGDVDLAAASTTGLTCLTNVCLLELHGQARGGPISGLSTLPVLEQLSLWADFDAEVSAPPTGQPGSLAAWQLATELVPQLRHHGMCGCHAM